MAVRVRVANLPPKAEEETARRLFARFGEVRSVRLVCSGPPRALESYCLVELRDLTACERAVHELDGRYCRGRLLAVDLVERSRSTGGAEIAVRRVVRAIA